MANKVVQHYNIKYPFTCDNYDGYFIDLNTTIEDRVTSEIAHVLLTRKGTRIRHPEFGTRLIEFIFEPNDELTWDGVESEIKTAVQQYVPSAMINEIEVVRSDDEDNKIYIDVRYGVTKGATQENKRMIITL